VPTPQQCIGCAAGVHVRAVPVELTAADLERLRAGDDGRPIVIAQLLRFAAGGRDQYLAYSREAQRVLRGLGAQIVYAGECIEPLGVSASQAWDVIVLVRYPSRTAYVEMLADPAFQQIAELRRKALRDAIFLLMDDWPGR
jgi:uncharacterized protein (DUF1330 family)